MEDTNLKPIFSTDGAGGQSILTDAESKDLLDGGPTSIFTLAKLHNLKKIYIREHHLINLVPLYKNSKKENIKLRFGATFSVVNNSSDPDSLKKKGCRVTLWMKNGLAYPDFCRFSSNAKTETDTKGKIDWEFIKDNLTGNLFLSFDFYNSFLYFNSFEDGDYIPKFLNKKDTFFEISEMGLPFDALLKRKVLEYVGKNGFKTINTHPVLYAEEKDFKAFMVYLISCKRLGAKTGAFEMPNLNHFGSNRFSFEHYCKVIGKEFKYGSNKETN